MITRKCPNCGKKCEVGTGIFFDKSRNVRCIHCKKPVLGLTSAIEAVINKPAKIEKEKATKETYYGYYGYAAGTSQPVTTHKNIQSKTEDITHPFADLPYVPDTHGPTMASAPGIRRSARVKQLDMHGMI